MVPHEAPIVLDGLSHGQASLVSHPSADSVHAERLERAVVLDGLSHRRARILAGSRRVHRRGAAEEAFPCLRRIGH